MNQDNPKRLTNDEIARMLNAGHCLRGRDLSNSDLSHSDLFGLRADQTDFSGARLVGVNLQQTKLDSCVFAEARLDGTHLAGSTIRDSTFEGATARHANIDDARIEDCNLEGADFAGASLRKTKLTESSWSRTSLRDADLEEAQGDGVEFRGTDLRNTQMVRTAFVDGDFRGADLRNASLAEGDFRGADFRGALLDDVDWTNTLLQGAIFDVNCHPVPSSTPFPRSSNANKAEARDPSMHLAETIQELTHSAVKSSSKGKLEVRDQIGAIGDAWRAWCTDSDARQPDDFAKLFNELKGLLGETDRDLTSGLDSLVEILTESNSNESLMPPTACRKILEELFPQLSDQPNDETLESLAATFDSLLNSVTSE